MTESNKQIQTFDILSDLLGNIINDEDQEILQSWKDSLKDLYPHGIWFRGESSKQNNTPNGNIVYNPLVPSIQRRYFNKYNKMECDIYNFMKEGNIFNEANLKHFSNLRYVIDKLCHMQQHGIPTRILDWTESILNALFFATSNKEDTKNDSKLFILNAFFLNRYVENLKYQNNNKDIQSNTQGSLLSIFGPSEYQVTLRANYVRSNWLIGVLEKGVEELSSSDKRHLTILFSQHYKDLYEWANNEFNCTPEMKEELKASNDSKRFNNYLSHPVGFTPIYSHERMFSQQSAYTIHGGARVIGNDGNLTLEKPISFQEINDNLNPKDKILIEVTIPNDMNKKISDGLINMGIHQGSIYLDKDNHSKHIAEFWQ